MKFLQNIRIPYTPNMAKYSKAIQSMVSRGLIQIKPAQKLNGESVAYMSAIYCEKKHTQYVLHELSIHDGWRKTKVEGQEKP